MKRIQLRIVWIMELIVIIALNLGAMRAISTFKSSSNLIDVWAAGFLPMANILAVAFFVPQGHRDTRRFLAGFELFGAAAVIVYTTGWVLSFEHYVKPYVDLTLKPVIGILGLHRTPAHLPIFYTVTAVALGLPQLTIAMIGGLVFREFRLANGASRRIG